MQQSGPEVTQLREIYLIARSRFKAV